MLFLLFLFGPTFAAYCGTSTIPYRFEVLPDGTYSLGCARPTCFGWDGPTGGWASQDHAFTNKYNGEPDGFLREVVNTRPIFDYTHPTVPAQTTLGCFPSANCAANQWVGGVVPGMMGVSPSTLCCNYPPLIQAESRGVASVLSGQFVSGGEVTDAENSVTHFDYLRNIQPITGSGGRVMGYNVELGRMQCRDPPARVSNPVMNQQPIPSADQPAQPPVEQPAAPAQPPVEQPGAAAPPSSVQHYYYPVQERWFFCFSSDSTVTVSDGSKRRMDQLMETDWVMVPSDDMRNVTMKPVRSWLHRLPKEGAEFVVILTASGQTIKLTPRHFIYKTDCSKPTESKMVTADKVNVGDCLFATDKYNHLQPSEVIHIGSVTQEGIYAPLTAGGKIVVDGVAASCMSEVSENNLVQSMHKNFVECGADQLTCALKESGFNVALEVARLILPISS